MYDDICPVTLAYVIIRNVMLCCVCYVMTYDAMLCIHDSYVYYVMNEGNNEITLIICYDFKSSGPHIFMYVMYIGILLLYVMLV